MKPQIYYGIKNRLDQNLCFRNHHSNVFGKIAGLAGLALVMFLMAACSGGGGDSGGSGATGATANVSGTV